MAYSLFLGLAIVTLFTTINLVEADWKDDMREYINMLSPGTCKTNLLKDISKYTDGDEACTDLYIDDDDITDSTKCKKTQIIFMYHIACEGNNWKAQTIRYILGLENGKCRSELFTYAHNIEPNHHRDACNFAKKQLDKSYVKDIDKSNTKTACPKNINQHFKEKVCDGAGMMMLGTLTALACFAIHLLNKF